MKKTIGKIASAILAAAVLFSVASCKNQLDYLDDTVALNKFNVLGLTVTGLDASYNGADISLMVKEGDNEIAYVSGKVADSYTTDKGETVGYKEGTAYIKLDKAKLFDGDSLKTSTFECYLKVGDDKITLLDGTNAKLSVPSTLPANLDEDGLKEKWVNVVVNGGYGEFSLAGSAKESDFVNVTLYNVKMDILECTKDTLPTGVTIETVAKTGKNQKFTVKLTGLKDNAGTEVVLGGSDISLTDGDLKGTWYDDSGAFKQKISDDGEVSWTFYGAAVNGGNIAAWGRKYESSVAGPEFVICGVSEEKEDGSRLLESSKSRNGTDGDSMNFMFPGYTIGNYDVTLTIDVSKVDDDKKEKADPVATEYGYTVAKITVSSEKLATAKEVLGDTGKLWFMDDTLTGESARGVSSTNYVTGKDITVEDKIGTVTFTIPEANRHTYFSKEMQLVKTPTVQVVYLKAGKTEFGVNCKNVEKVLEGKESSNVYAWEYAGKNVELKINEKNECTFEVCPMYISEVKLINATDVKDGTSIKFLEGWIPGNTWSADTPVAADIKGGVASYTFASPAAVSDKYDKLCIQIVYLKDGETEFGTSWKNVIKICPSSYTVANKYDMNKYILQFDAKAKELTLVAVTE